MERLTKVIDNGRIVTTEAEALSYGETDEEGYFFNYFTGDAITKLARYEDKGYEPDEIAELSANSAAKDIIIKRLEDIYKKLRAYEDLEEQGRLVVLPCKVGDTVYRVWPYRKPIITEHKMHDITEIAKYIDAFGITFGKTVFLSREEAEKALEGVSADA